jgi:hypothetical protein
MSGGRDRRDDKFSIYVPKDDAPPEAPDYLEIVDVGPGGTPTPRLQGGAYDPYQKLEAGTPGDTARVRRPRVDLRKLSEWIKTQQRVKELREEEEKARQKAGQEKNGLTGRFRWKK